MTNKALTIANGKFIYGKNCLEMLHDEILKFGDKILIIGGPTSIRLFMDRVNDQLRKNNIKIQYKIHNDFCTRNWAKKYSTLANTEHIDVIVGVGGGKVLDLAKCVSVFSHKPIITVPTSIATCAASSAVSIMYDNQGRPDGSVKLDKEVDVVFADDKLIETAPKRLLAAGILDSLAKLPEVMHKNTNLTYQKDGLNAYAAFVNSKLIYEFLTNEAKDLYENTSKAKYFEEAIVVNLLITSIVSGFSSGLNQLAIAHALYDFMRFQYPESEHIALHGEIVGVGLLMQLAFNGSSHEEVVKYLHILDELDAPKKLTDIGFDPSEENINLLQTYIIKKTKLSDHYVDRFLKTLPLVL